MIVRRYEKKVIGPSAEAQFSEEAQILAQQGYWPATQSFAANNALLGAAIGTGYLTVSFAKQQGSAA